jgi:hypothetical protein
VKPLFHAALAAVTIASTMAAATNVFGGNALTEWFPIKEWGRCAELARTGLVFEIRNSDGLSLFAECSTLIPEAPWDWQSPPIEFRAVPQLPAERSMPLPEAGK